MSPRSSKCSVIQYYHRTQPPPIRHPWLSGGLFEHRVQTLLLFCQNIKNFYASNICILQTYLLELYIQNQIATCFSVFSIPQYAFQFLTYDSTGDLLKQRKFYELLVNLRNRRYSKNPAIDVILSVTGNVSQKKFSPIFENAYPSGTNKNTVLTTVSILLVNAFPTA